MHLLTLGTCTKGPGLSLRTFIPGLCKKLSSFLSFARYFLAMQLVDFAIKASLKRNRQSSCHELSLIGHNNNYCSVTSACKCVWIYTPKNYYSRCSCVTHIILLLWLSPCAMISVRMNCNYIYMSYSVIESPLKGTMTTLERSQCKISIHDRINVSVSIYVL